MACQPSLAGAHHPAGGIDLKPCRKQEKSNAKGYAELTKRISGGIRKLRKDIPDTMQAFSALAQAATRDGALDKKTKELIALALGVAARCDGCIGFHMEALATRQTPSPRSSNSQKS
jgi:AhpD family alkylhydroperoxidase